MSIATYLRKMMQTPNTPAGVLDADGLSRSLRRARARANRADVPFALALFSLGEDQCDDSLELLCRILARRVRMGDEIGVMGDDEVGVLLDSTPPSQAAGFCDRVLADIDLMRGRKLVLRGCRVLGYPQPPRSETRSNSPTTQDAAEPSESGLPDSASETLFTRGMPAWKRTMDMTGALFVLTLCSPLLAAASLLIKAVSPGPVFYRQLRIGCGGRPFVMLKLRTMHAGCSSQAHSEYVRGLIQASAAGVSAPPMRKLDADSRIIPGGRWLRKSCIDELPQLFNVLRGEMSLVGPRPPLPYEVDAYSRWWTERLDVLPGMTGLWQVSGKNRLTFTEMMRLDIHYAARMSPWLDISILARTPLAVAGLLFEHLHGAPSRQEGGKRHA